MNRSHICGSEGLDELRLQEARQRVERGLLAGVVTSSSAVTLPSVKNVEENQRFITR